MDVFGNDKGIGTLTHVSLIGCMCAKEPSPVTQLACFHSRSLLEH